MDQGDQLPSTTILFSTPNKNNEPKNTKVEKDPKWFDLKKNDVMNVSIFTHIDDEASLCQSWFSCSFNMNSCFELYLLVSLTPGAGLVLQSQLSWLTNDFAWIHINH